MFFIIIKILYQMCYLNQKYTSKKSKSRNSILCFFLQGWLQNSSAYRMASLFLEFLVADLLTFRTNILLVKSLFLPPDLIFWAVRSGLFLLISLLVVSSPGLRLPGVLPHAYLDINLKNLNLFGLFPTWIRTVNTKFERYTNSNKRKI